MPDITNVYDEISIIDSAELSISDAAINVQDSVSITEAVDAVRALSVDVNDIAWAWDEPYPDEDPNPVVNPPTGLFGTDTRPDHYPLLPMPSLVARFRETISITGKAPTVKGSARFGSFATGVAPVVYANISLNTSFGSSIILSEKRVPTVSGSLVFGSRMFGKAPTVTGSITLNQGDIVISGTAPAVVAELIEIPNYFISISGKAPFPYMKATLSYGSVITVSGIAPAVVGSAEVTDVGTITIAGIAPVTKADYNDIQLTTAYIIVSGTAPVVSMYDPIGITDPGGIAVAEEDRFTDVTLQYKRWPDAI